MCNAVYTTDDEITTSYHALLVVFCSSHCKPDDGLTVGRNMLFYLHHSYNTANKFSCVLTFMVLYFIWTNNYGAVGMFVSQK